MILCMSFSNLIKHSTLTGRQTIINRRSAVAKLARNVFVGDLNEDFFITVKMIRMLPDTPREKVKLKFDEKLF